MNRELLNRLIEMEKKFKMHFCQTKEFDQIIRFKGGQLLISIN